MSRPALHAGPGPADITHSGTMGERAVVRNLARAYVIERVTLGEISKLGVHPGTVAQWMHRGALDRHPDGGVLRASVLQRLAR